VAKIIWSQKSIRDIEVIAEFISQDSIERANNFVQKLIESTDRLMDFPYSGRIIQELGDKSVREVIYGSYRIMYKIQNNEVFISGIIHTARNWNEF